MSEPTRHFKITTITKGKVVTGRVPKTVLHLNALGYLVVCYLVVLHPLVYARAPQ